MTYVPREIRLALVTGQLDYGGAERQLTELALRVRPHGVEPRVFCLGGTDQPFGDVLRAAGVSVSRVARRGGFDWHRAVELARLLRKGRFDLVHSFLIDTNPYAFLAAKLARTGCFMASNRNVDFTRGAARAWIDSLVFRSAATIVVNAGAVRAFTAARFRVPEQRCSVIYNGVDLDRFRPAATRPAAATMLGTVCSLLPKKNPQMFVDVATALARSYRGLSGMHLGDGQWRPTLNGAGNSPVRFLGTSAKVESFLSGLDVFVLTSDREGCPNVLLEAMATGLPIVATDAGGCGELIRDGETGYITPCGDRAAMIARIRELLDDPALRIRLGRAAREDAERRFSIDRMVADMVRLYRRLTEPSDRCA